MENSVRGRRVDEKVEEEKLVGGEMDDSRARRDGG